MNRALTTGDFFKPTRLAQLALDLVVFASSFAFAYLVRFDFQIPDANLANLWVQLPVVVAVRVVALASVGAYRLMWRYVSLSDMPVFIKATLYGTAPLLLLRLISPLDFAAFLFPLSILFMDSVLSFGGILALRIIRRSIHEDSKRRGTRVDSPAGARQRVILVGAGRAGALSIREMRGRGDLSVEPIGFVDDDPLKQGSIIAGSQVLGMTRELPELVKKYDVDHAVITIAEAQPSDIQRIVKICEQIPIKVRTIPGYYDLLQGKVSIRRIRDVEPDDLLGRQAVNLDTERLKELVAGKAVLVTGAGGSIGSELALQAARFRPQALLLVERNEYALFEVHRKLSDLWPELPIVPLIADCCDAPRMKEILGASRPEILFHVAAHKHVPMMEGNPGEAVKNNVMATRLLGELAAEAEVGTFVLISTDKAVRPKSIMGASKRVAEMVVQDLARRHATRYTAVRFGNVLGSTGSVIPIFNEQISRGGPVTVTDERMTRYFMSVSEAAQLVLTAASFSEGGEVFILDMGEPVSIVKLAEKLITLSGFEPYEDIDIVFTGRRPGEKIHEELGSEGEQLVPTENPKIFVTTSAPPPASLDATITELQRLVDGGADAESIRSVLDDLIPDSLLSRAVDSWQ